MSLSDLKRFQVGASPLVSRFVTGPPMAVYPERMLLAFDQSLANTGWALIEGVTIHKTGNIKTAPSAKGHEGNLSRAWEVKVAVDELLEYLEPDFVVHELPPMPVPGMRRPESSLLAAAAVQFAARGAGVPMLPMVSAQAAKMRWAGDSNADKKRVRESIQRLDPAVRVIKPMNEATYDAIAVGWFAAEQKDLNHG